MKNIREATPFISFVFGIVFLALAGTWVFNLPAVHDTLDSWGVLPRPERLTELYFTDHKNLPTNYSSNTQSSVAFTLHNIEYKPVKYDYKIEQQSDDKTVTKTLATGTKNLNHDETSEISVPITLQDTGEKARIVVSVSYVGTKDGTNQDEPKNLSIFYYVRQKGGAN